jgi:hypothetical protein
MRSSRLHTAVLTAIAGAVLAAVPLAAQGTAQPTPTWDLRTDAWYWGMYGGQTSFATSVTHTTAPMFGVEWTITRRRFALNVFAEQSYFNSVSTVADFPSSAPRNVNIQDMRRVGASGMFFLPQYKYFHPWFGAGYGFNFIRSATPQGTSYASAAARDSVEARVNNARAQGELFGEFGMMFAYKEWAPFLQYTVMPTQGTGSWFVNGDRFTNIWKLGFRYTFGPSVEDKW